MNITLQIELPEQIYSKLLAQSALLQKTPSLLIAHALKDELGLVGIPLDDDEIFGEGKSAVDGARI